MAITTEAVAARLAARLAEFGVELTDADGFAAAFAADLADWVGGAEAVPVALANKVSSTATAWNTDVMQRLDWWTGPADGGPNGDGMYPMVNAAGVETMFPSLAKLIDQTQKGNAGWTAKTKIEPDGATRAVVRILDWVGGEGTKPATGYIAEDGSLVGTAAAAYDVFGALSATLTTLKNDSQAARDAAAATAASLSLDLGKTSAAAAATYTGPGPVGERALMSESLIGINRGGVAGGQLVGTDIPVRQVLSSFAAWLQVNTSTATVRLKLWKRATSSASLTAAPGAVGDVLLDTVSLAPAAIGLTPGASATALATFPLSASITAEDGTLLLQEIEAFDASSAKQPIGIGVNSTSGVALPYRGFYRFDPAAANYTAFATGVCWAWRWIGDTYGSYPALAARATALEANAASVALDMGKAQSAAAALYTGQATAGERTYISDSLIGVGRGGVAGGQLVGTDIPNRQVLTAFSAWLQVNGSTTDVRLKLWKRAATSASLTSAPGAAGDVLIDTVNLSPAAIGLTPDAPAMAMATFPLTASITAEPGTLLLQEIDAFDASSVKQPIGIGINNTSGVALPYRGFYRFNSTSTGYTAFSTTASWAWRWTGDTYGSYTALAARATALEAGASAATLTTKRQPTLVAALTPGGYSALVNRQGTGLSNLTTDNHALFAAGFDVGVDIAADSVVDAIGADLLVTATCANVIMKLYSRPTSASTTGPGAAGDELIATVTMTPAALGLTGGAAAAARVWFPLPTPLVTVAGLSYIASFDAVDSGGARLIIGAGLATTSGYSQTRRGWYYGNASSTSFSLLNSTTSLNMALGQTALLSSAAIKAQADGLGRDIADFQASFPKSNNPIGLRTKTASTNSSVGQGGFAVGLISGTDLAVDALVKRFTVGTSVASTATAFVFRLWSRPIGAAWLTQSPGQSGDTLVASVTQTPAAAGLTPGQATNQTATIVLPDTLKVAAGLLYIIEIEARDSGGTRVAIGVDSTSVVAGLTQQQKGWYRSTPAANYGNFNASVAMAWGAEGDIYKVPNSTVLPASGVDQVAACSATVNGYVVTVSALSSILSRMGSALPFGGAVTLTAPATGSVTGEARTLYPPTPTAAVPGNYADINVAGYLAHANVSSVVVKDASTSAVLVEGTDYLLNAENGAVALTVGSSGSRAVLVDYTWSNRRYDVIHLDAETLALGVTAGAERVRDAAELIPSAPAGKLPLFHARVVSGSVELVAVWEVFAGERRSLASEAASHRRRNRRILRPILGKLQKGLPLKIQCYGDSLGSMQNAAPSVTTPNGAARDRATSTGGWFLSNPVIGSDVYTALPLYDFGDGAGAVHTKFSFMWTLIQELEQVFDSAITFENWSIGGTNSSNTGNNGLSATRRAAWNAAPADLVVIHFGGNEIGSTSTLANMSTLIADAIAAGKVPVVLGALRPNAQRNTYANWQLTNRMLQRAAEAGGAAFIPTTHLYADDSLGVIGMSTKDLGLANATNHPGIREMNAVGQALAAAFLDE